MALPTSSSAGAAASSSTRNIAPNHAEAVTYCLYRFNCATVHEFLNLVLHRRGNAEQLLRFNGCSAIEQNGYRYLAASELERMVREDQAAEAGESLEAERAAGQQQPMPYRILNTYRGDEGGSFNLLCRRLKLQLPRKKIVLTYLEISSPLDFLSHQLVTVSKTHLSSRSKLNLVFFEILMFSLPYSRWTPERPPFPPPPATGRATFR